jgi:hypothetical protein
LARAGGVVGDGLSVGEVKITANKCAATGLKGLLWFDLLAFLGV